MGCAYERIRRRRSPVVIVVGNASVQVRVRMPKWKENLLLYLDLVSLYLESLTESSRKRVVVSQKRIGAESGGEKASKQASFGMTRMEGGACLAPKKGNDFDVCLSQTRCQTATLM